MGDSSFPETTQAVLHVLDTPIRVIFYRFDDRWVIHLTQNGKLGSWVEAEVERTKGKAPAPSAVPCFEVKVLMGDREDLWTQVLCRQLLCMLSVVDGFKIGLGTKPLLLGLGCKITSEEQLRAIVSECCRIMNVEPGQMKLPEPTANEYGEY